MTVIFNASQKSRTVGGDLPTNFGEIVMCTVLPSEKNKHEVVPLKYILFFLGKN